jgi:glycosyltransferase involved in cell wall biosynthesis
MKVAILLPYKENFSNYETGAVSIFVNSINELSKYKDDITIFGSTNFKPLSENYENLNLKKKFYLSSSKIYVENFLKKLANRKFDILEIHNRPHYLNYISNIENIKKIIFFHNNPLQMQGSETKNDRLNIYNKADALIFNSIWTKTQFLKDLPIDIDKNKIKLVPQSTSKVKINFSKKKKIISFVGKLNSSKGYDIFGDAVIRILNKYPGWSSIVIGNEPRQKLFYNHSRLKILGFKDNDYVLNKLKEVSISVVPSKWDEPFGRSSLEAASRGCAVIRSDKGGLNETTNASIILNKLTSDELYKYLDFLIRNPINLKKLQVKTYKQFKLTNNNSSFLLDRIRNELINPKKKISIKCLKILHITNFNERFNGRLHYNTSKRINNALIKLGHNVYQLSDRDIISSNRSIFNLSPKKILNKKIIEIGKNFNPDLIILGHADSVKLETLRSLKNKNNNLKISQWFLDPLSRNGPDYLNNKKRILNKIEIIDSTFLTSDPESLDFKIKNSYFIPNPADKSFETLDNSKKSPKNDVFFAMSHGVHRGNLKPGKYDDREKMLKKLLRVKNIKFDFYGINNIQPIWGDEFLKKISLSKIGLNLSRGKPLKYYSSDRIAQYMANGLMTFTHEDTKYLDFFNKNEIVTYKNLKDLISKIKYYVKNDKKRKFIANNGKKKYLKEFNSEKVSKFIILKTFDIKSKDKFIWDKKNNILN